MSNSHIFLKSGFLSAPLQNGVGRYVCQLQRITLKFCKSHGSSRGMREFIESDLINFAKENPGVVVYLKPRRHKGPHIIAEYLNGDKQHVYVSKQTPDVITKWVNVLKNQAGNHEMMRFRKMWHTEFPSIQGPWTPYTFRDPELNLAEFPSIELRGPEVVPKSATEELLEVYKKQKGLLEDMESNRAN